MATHSVSLKERCKEVSSATKGSRDERKTFAATKEDLEQNTTDIPVLMQQQMLVIHKAPVD